jgi:hypothetical protein
MARADDHRTVTMRSSPLPPPRCVVVVLLLLLPLLSLLSGACTGASAGARVVLSLFMSTALLLQ